MGLPLIVGMFLMITAAALVYYYQHEIRSIFKGIDVLIAWITAISLTTGAASILFDQYRLYRNKMKQINNYSVK